MAFTARHSAAEVASAFRRLGLSPGMAPPVRLALPRPVLFDAWNTLGVPRLDWLSASLGQADIVHAPSVAVPPRGRVPLVVTVHDVAPLLFPSTFPWHGRFFHRRGLEAAARRADLVITVSQAAAAEISALTSIGSDRVRVVPNGVDHIPARPSEIAATLEKHQLTGVPYVLWVGSLEPRKNVGLLVLAFDRLVSGPAGAGAALSHRLVLAGPSGWLDSDLVPLPVRERLGDRLRLLGQVADDADLRALYAGADLFAFPSRHEGFGLPVLEAMVQGTPVVCADIPALREVAGGAAHFLPADDVGAWVEGLASLLDDESARSRLAAAGRLRAGDFSWERTVAATRAVYLEALGR